MFVCFLLKDSDFYGFRLLKIMVLCFKVLMMYFQSVGDDVFYCQSYE